MIGLCLANRYEVRAELGQGGMATVYRADDRVLGREVAVKVISTHTLTAGAVERFEREARLVGRLDHPAVVPIYDFGRDDDQLFFVMPVLEGETLHRRLRDRPPTLAQTLEILARVAEALDHSASRGVVHRDVKPENVMVSLRSAADERSGGAEHGADSVERVWVMDFGLALGRASSRLTKAGNLPGTLAYLSPEQVLAADALDGRSDLYSVGVILYQCLFGRPPFSGAPASVLYRIVHEKPPIPDDHGVDPLLLDLLGACLEKRPEDRIQSGGELARALREVSEVIDTSGPVAVGRWRRRGRAPQVPLVGRDDELKELRRAFDRALPGELQVRLVSGHPGQGKTRLLEALEDETRGRGALVLRGRFAERESTYPYQAFCELLQDYFRQLHEGSLPSSHGSSHASRASRSGTSGPPHSSGSRSALRSGSGSGSGSRSGIAAHGDAREPDPPDLVDLAPDLLALFPALAEIPEVQRAADEAGPPPPGGTVQDDPTHLYELVARTLGRLAGGRPTVLVLEQLHAADASLDLIQYLTRRLSSAPILLAGSYRPASVGRRHPLVRLIRGLRDDPRFRDLRLRPLSAEAHAELVDELLGAPAEPDLAQRVFDATEGNPFFTRELLSALLDRGEVTLGEGGVFRGPASGRGDRASGDGSSGDLTGEARDDPATELLAPTEVPETIQQAVSARLERLAETPRRALEAASVLGRRFSERDLEELTPGDEDEVEEAVDTLIAHGLLEEDRSSRRGDRLRFPSGLLRDVVYRQMSRRRRRRLHRAHADALAERSQRRLERVAHELLHHYAQAGVADETLRFGRLYARRSLDAYCWDDALYACAVALEFTDGEDRPEDEAELRRCRAAALAAKGLLGEAQVEGARAFERLRATAREVTEPATNGADESGDAAAAEVALFLAETAWRARQVDETRRWLAQGAELARAAGDGARTVLVSLLHLDATVKNLGGDADAARELLAEAARLQAADDDAGTEHDEADRAGVEPGGRGSVPRGGTLRVAMNGSVTGLDPVDALSAQDAEITGLLYEPLLRLASENGRPGGDGARNEARNVARDVARDEARDVARDEARDVARDEARDVARDEARDDVRQDADASRFEPLLGEWWARSDDGLRYRFHIDTGRTFADGSRLTAPRVKQSFEEAARRAASRRPAALDALAEIDAPADDELVLRLETPLAAFPALLTDPRTAVVRRSAEGAPAGTGPFRLAERSDERLSLSRRDESPRAPRLDAVEILLRPGSREVARAWRGGECQLARDLAPADVEDFLRHGGDGRLVETPQNNVYFVLLNPRGPHLRDPELRRVLATSVDSRQLVWSTVPRFASPLAGWLPPEVPGHDPERRDEPMGRADAIAAMDAFRPLPVRLRAVEHPAFGDTYRAVADALCDAWHLLGVEVERRATSISEFSDAMADLDAVDLVFGRWWPDYPDPDGFFFGAFHSAAGLFRAALASPELDRAIEAARREDEPSARVALYRELEERLLRPHLVRPLFHDIEYRLASPRLAGLRTSPTAPFVDYGRLGLHRRGAATEVERRSGRLVVPLGSRIDILDPAWSFHADAAEVVANVFEPLTRLDEAAVAVPHLAERLESDDGGRRWLCTLHETRFHDGRRLTARDVRYSFDRLLRTGSPDLRTFLSALEGADEAMAGRGDLQGVRLLGDRRLELRLRRPVPHFAALLSNVATAVVPEGTRDFGPTWRHGTAGTGPFRLVAFQPGRRAELVAYGDYRRPGLPKVAELVFEQGIEPHRAAQGFTSGQFSMLSHLESDDLEEFSRTPRFAAGLVDQPSFTTYFATLTSVTGPLAHPNRRRRVAALLADLRPRLGARLGRLGQPAGRLIPPSLLGLSDPVADPARADAGAADARGISEGEDADGLDGVTLRVALHPSYGISFRRLWREIRGALETAGIEVDPVRADFPEVLQLMQRGRIDLVFARWVADVPDPSSFAQILATGPAAGQWNDPDLPELAERAMAELDRDLRRRLYLDLERLLAERAYLVPLFHEQSWRLVRPGIDGLRLRYGWPEVVYEELKIRA